MTVKELLGLAEMRIDYIDICDMKEGIDYYDVSDFYARLYYGNRVVESFDYDAKRLTLAICIEG